MTQTLLNVAECVVMDQQLSGWRQEEKLRSIRVAFTGMAIAFSMVTFGIAEPASAKVPKDCRNDRHHQANQSDECRDIIIENLDGGSSSTTKYYRSNAHKAKKHKIRTKTN
jgi:hypothetical protein